MIKKALLVGGASVGLVVGGLSTPASAADYRLAFNDVSQGSGWEVQLGDRHFTSVAKLWNNGKQVGFGVLNCKVLLAVQQLDCSYVASLMGGTVSVKLDPFSFDGADAGHYTGSVVGGTGKYSGARGTVVGTQINNRVVRVVLTFHT